MGILSQGQAPTSNQPVPEQPQAGKQVAPQVSPQQIPGNQQPDQMNQPQARQQKPVKAADQQRQDSYDKFVIEGLKILHDDKAMHSIIKSVMSSENKIDAIGESALVVVKKLESSKVGNTFKITANTIVNGLNVIVGEIVNMAESAGLQKLDKEQKYQAFSWAWSNYLKQAVKSGKITQEELQKAGQNMGKTDIGAGIMGNMNGGRLMDSQQPTQQTGQQPDRQQQNILQAKQPMPQQSGRPVPGQVPQGGI